MGQGRLEKRTSRREGSDRPGDTRLRRCIWIRGLLLAFRRLGDTASAYGCGEPHQGCDREDERRQRWLLFKEIEPGHRFHNKRRRRERGETSRYGSIFNLGGGLTLVVAGFAFLPTPGPSYIIIVRGLWMLAGEWLPLARMFDRIEVRLRELGRWIKGRWTRSPAAVRTLVVLILLAALGYGAYGLLF